MFSHGCLQQDELGTAVARVFADSTPAAMRSMVARGLAPLGPRDLLVALYQFWVTNDRDFATIAGKTVLELPRTVLMGALQVTTLPPGVLDFLARKFPRDAEVLERIVGHPRVHDESLAGLARVCPESVCELLASNQRRWLGCPAIVEALYENASCSMSTIQRVLELAVRERVALKLPNMDEIRATLGTEGDADPERDRVFRVAAGQDVLKRQESLASKLGETGVADTFDFYQPVGTEADELLLDDLLEQGAVEELELPLADDGSALPPVEGLGSADGRRVDRLSLISQLRPAEKVRLALLGSAFERSVLIRDQNKAVCMSAIKSPRVKENEVVAYAANRSLPHEVVGYISRRRDWTKLYAVKFNLVLNPKTPMSVAMTFLTHLHAHDVRKVAHSKNIAAALAQAAKRRMALRR